MENIRLYDAIKSFAFLCVAFGMILLIKDYNRRWIRSYENLKENPTLEKLTLFYYRYRGPHIRATIRLISSSMKSRQLNVFFHWLLLWPVGKMIRWDNLYEFLW